MKDTPKLTYEQAHDLFILREGVLYWRDDRHGGRIKAGTKAGTINASNRQVIRLGPRADMFLYYRSRIVWLLAYGHWPQGFIDHVDHDVLNDDPNNLRDVSNRINTMNAGLGKANTSGYLGVVWLKTRQSWRAQITVKGKHISLKQSKDINVCIAARAAADRKYGFHANHGN